MLAPMQATVRRVLQQGTYPKQFYATFKSVALQMRTARLTPTALTKLCHFLTDLACHIEIAFDCEQN